MPVTLFVTLFFFFNDTATTEIYTLSLHDALPISRRTLPLLCLLFLGGCQREAPPQGKPPVVEGSRPPGQEASDRKSTRLNSSHANISYAVFCLKKKKKYTQIISRAASATPSLT